MQGLMAWMHNKGIEAEGFQFRVQSLGFRIFWGQGFRIQCLGFRSLGLGKGFRV